MTLPAARRRCRSSTGDMISAATRRRTAAASGAASADREAEDVPTPAADCYRWGRKVAVLAEREAEYVPTPAAGSTAIPIAAMPSAAVPGRPPEAVQPITGDSGGDDADMHVVPAEDDVGLAGGHQPVPLQDCDGQAEVAALREELMREVVAIDDIEVARAALASLRASVCNCGVPALAAAGEVTVAATPAPLGGVLAVPEVAAAAGGG